MLTRLSPIALTAIALVMLLWPIPQPPSYASSAPAPFVSLPPLPYTLDDEDHWKSDCGEPESFHPFPTGCKQREVNVI